MDAALSTNGWYEAIQESISIAAWAGVPSAALGAATAYVIIGTSATAGVLFGGAAAVMFTIAYNIILLVESLFRKDLMSAGTRILLSIIVVPLGGWAVCAATGFALTALQIIALTISSYVGGAFGLKLGATYRPNQTT